MAEPAGGDAAAAARSRLDAAHAAADRLMREARERAAAVPEDGVPPYGWAAPPSAGAAPAGADLQQLVALFELLRGAVPPELARQLADAMRELLLALRTIIDWNLERLDHAPPARVEVEDIPID